VDDPPAVSVGRPAIQAACDEVDEEQGNAKVEAFFGLFHNGGKEDGTDQCADQDGGVIDPTFPGPNVEVLGGEDPIDGDGGAVHHVIALDAKAEGQVVKGLEGNDLRKYEAGVEGDGIGAGFRLPGMRSASATETS